MTTAAWLRQFVTSHPDYKKDSVVTDEIAYDLVVACQEIGLVRTIVARTSGNPCVFFEVVGQRSMVARTERLGF